MKKALDKAQMRIKAQQADKKLQSEEKKGMERKLKQEVDQLQQRAGLVSKVCSLSVTQSVIVCSLSVTESRLSVTWCMQHNFRHCNTAGLSCAVSATKSSVHSAFWQCIPGMVASQLNRSDQRATYFTLELCW